MVSTNFSQELLGFAEKSNGVPPFIMRNRSSVVVREGSSHYRMALAKLQDASICVDGCEKHLSLGYNGCHHLGWPLFLVQCNQPRFFR